MSTNKAAFLDAAASPLRVGDLPMPAPGPNDIVIRNRAISVKPLDNSQASRGYMVKAFPHVLGSDIAGEVHSVGTNVTRFKPGDRVLAKSWGALNGQAEEGAFALYTKVQAANAASVAESVSFVDAAVLPCAIDTATAGLFTPSPGMGLEWPKISASASSTAIQDRVVVVYGASSSVGSVCVQLAAAAGCKVIGIASGANAAFVKEAGAEVALDYRNPAVVDEVIQAIGSADFVGLFDSIGTEDSHKVVVPVMKRLGRGSLCTTKMLPEELPAGIQTKRVFAMGDFSFPLWEKFVSGALANGQLKCLPRPVVVGKGLESLQLGLDRLNEGVSAQKVVVEV